MRKYLLPAICLLAASCSHIPKPTPKYDAVIYVQPVWVESLQNGGTSDAVMGTPDAVEKPTAKVVFDVLRVAEGNFHVREGGPSISEQMKQAWKDKNPLAMLDYKDPNRQVMRDLISVAVADPGASFGITSWANPGKKRFKLYLKEAEGRKGSYYLVKIRA